MYKVFYNEKLLLLTDSPLPELKTLKYSTNSQFDEAIALLRNTSIDQINIYYHNLDKLWNNFKSGYTFLEAAGGIVKNQNNQILFIFRLGKWDLPKGKVEKGESIQMAALREVTEECGIGELNLGEPVCETYHLYFLKEFILKTVYWYKMTTESDCKPIPQNEEGIEIAAWKEKTEIPKLMEQTYENIKIVLQKYFETA